MFRILFFLVSFLCTQPLIAKVETGHLFVHLSDAMAEIKKGAPTQALPYLNQLQTEFQAIPSHNSSAGQAVENALKSAKSIPNDAQFEQLSKALLAFEKEQNPVDYQAKREQFAKRVIPIYQRLNNAVLANELDAVQTEYKRFNTTWTANEKVVRETSLGHYGQIETAMTLLRIAMLSEPANFTEMAKQSAQLGSALVDFKAGNVLQPQTATQNAPTTLPQGINLLEQSYSELEQGKLDQARANITLFIQQWAIFEGEVRTRDGALYTQVESELPVMLVKGNEPKNLAQFRQLIDALSALDTRGSYGIIDAMLVLLREGVEALLIIMALLTTLNVAKQPQAKRWVFAGAGLGLGASLLGALALQQLFPVVSAGTNREILEGAVGLIAVVMMLFVGAWLHSKSSVQGWQRFIDKQVGNALASGSLLSMLSLSFLSVFREGAETVLFYAGMLPLMSLRDLLLGIGFALLLLALIALVMHMSSQKLPIPRLFKLMTWLIYCLGFKILGVSIHTLQLTQIFSRHLLESVPSFPSFGFYASVEGISAQLLYLLLILLIAKYVK